MRAPGGSCAAPDPGRGFHARHCAVLYVVMEPASFELVVATHPPEIHRYLVRMTGRAAEAEDLSQETFLRAYRAYRTLLDDANVRAWLFAIATNLFRNHVRSERRRSTAHAEVRAAGTEADGRGPEGETLFH